MSERIETTVPKAKELRRLADEVITLGKEGTLHARRQAAAILMDPAAVRKLFDGNGGLSARFSDRKGGYTRIYKFGFRRGDGAEMAAIEYLGYQLPEPKPKKEEGKKAEKAVEKPKVEKKAKTEKKPEKKVTEKKAAPKEKTGSKESKKEGKWGIFGRKKKEE